jgi:hypothetical protein
MTSGKRVCARARTNRLLSSAVRVVAAGIVGLLGVTNSAMAQQLPSVKLQTAPLVPPQTAITWYNTQTLVHNPGVAAPTSPYPEVVELARALGASRYTPSGYAHAVYEYVRNNIAIEFRFGLSKGGRGALIDQSGTAFDQT